MRDRLLLIHGKIHTMNPEYPLAEAAVIENGHILVVGTDEEILKYDTPEARKLDLNHYAVYPGMIDSHMHVLETAADACGIRMDGIRKRTEILRLVQERAAVVPRGQMIEGFRFNEDLWDDPRMITAEELDRIAPEHPVRLVRCCGHLVVANHVAIRAAGIHEGTVFPGTCTVDLEKGIFTEDAIPIINANRCDQGKERCKELLLNELNHLADVGITCVYSDDFGAAGFSMKTVAEAYLELAESGKMPVRVLQQCYLPEEEDLERFLSMGYRYMQGNDYYRFGPRKLYIDGGIGARTAWLTRPYNDQPETTGVPVSTPEQMERHIRRAHEAEMPAVVHAIGDAGIECVLDCIEAVRRTDPAGSFFRDGVIHCQVTSEHTLNRICDVNADIYAQPVFLEYDLHICENRVGKELAETSYNWKTILENGVCLSSGSDCPVDTPDVARNIYCAVTRKDFDGIPDGGWFPEQCLSVEEAVLCHTLLAARAGNLENDLGSICAGKLADFTVYPSAFDEIPADRIMYQKPVMTIIGGKVRRTGEKEIWQ